MRTKSPVHLLTKVVVDILFFGGIICCAALPFFQKPMMTFLQYTMPDYDRLQFLAVLEISGLACVYALWQLKKALKTVLKGNPFIEANVSVFRRIAVASFVIALVYFIHCIAAFNVAQAAIIILFIVVGLFSLTLKDIFKQAVHYKDENDYTV